MNFSRVSARFLSALVALSITTTACTKKAPSTDGKKVAKFLFKDDVKHADPAQANDVISGELMMHIFEGLMAFNYLGNTDSVVPLLADGKPVFSNKNRTVTFKIRKGIFFQDDAAFPGGKGREVKADDFVYSFKRIADPRLNSVNWWVFDGMIEGLNDWRTSIEKAPTEQRDALFEKPVKGLSTTNDGKLVLQLTRPYPQLLQILSMTHASAVAREVVQKYGQEIINHPVGTGPFRLKSWVRGSAITVERNPTFRKDFYPTVGSDEDRKAGLLQAAGKQVPFLDEIRWDIIKEEQPGWLKFRSGDLDRAELTKDYFLEVIDGNGQLKPEVAKEGIQLNKLLTLTGWWLEFNLKDPLLGKNLKLRQALATAFDRARALELLFNNRGILTSSPIPPSIEGGAEVPPSYPYEFNIEKAKALLAEAGYPGGKGLPEITFDLRGPGTTPRQLGELLKDNFQKIGVNLSILANSFPEALEKSKTSRFQIMLGGWAADYPDPENFMQLFYSGNAAPGTNTSNFNNKEFDALYQQIRTEAAGPHRKKALHRMNEILLQEAPIAPFYHSVEYWLSWKQLKNFKPSLFFWGMGKYLDLER
ncbi:MAG: hypothetical protein JST16_05600 [Bdellovibrionales bacterium]|nr:hypothetical protein [Bdellovibrionales bacterium]